jgi:hypothetical protein
VTITPAEGEVPAAGKLAATVSVTAHRVGHHGIFGIGLEVRGSPGLFEVPLAFANPYGIEVLPAPYANALHSARGGRSRTVAEEGRPGPLPGDGLELREIRELVPGDPFKRIAWKASARRGRLLVREYEREERDTVWILLDASVELWSGRSGKAPLDLAIDEIATLTLSRLARGDQVGLAIAGSRPLAFVPPGKGPAHGAMLMQALALAPSTLHADRSDLDLEEVSGRVLEHLRTLDPGLVSTLSVRDPERLARHARRLHERAPFEATEIFARTPAEKLLRTHLARFGLSSPPRQEPEGPRTDLTLAALLDRCLLERPRPSIVHIWAPLPPLAPRPALQAALQRRPRRGARVLWVPMRFEPGLPRDDVASDAIAEALSIQVQIAQREGFGVLRALGVRPETIRTRSARQPSRTPSLPESNE